MANRLNNKKGLFFTLMSILFIGLFFIWTMPDNYVSSINRVPVIEDRVLVADSYVNSIETVYVKRLLAGSSYLALHSLAIVINRTNLLLTDFDELNAGYKSILLNNSLDQNDLPTFYDVHNMEGNTLPELFGRVGNVTYDTMHINLSFHNLDAMIFSQEDPWFVKVYLNYTFHLDAGVASWNKTVLTNSSFSILSLYDPLYFRGTCGQEYSKISNLVNGTHTDILTAERMWNMTHFLEHLEKRTYKTDANAPSYLQRFYNDFTTSDCCGIESAINFTSLTNRSFIDYCFWSDACEGSSAIRNMSLYNMTSITTDDFLFKIELYHVGIFDLPVEDMRWFNVSDPQPYVFPVCP